MDSLILPARDFVRGSVRPPGSKSISNRALPLAALATGTTRLLNLPDGEDVELMREALRRLASACAATGASRDYRPGRPVFRARGSQPVNLFLGNSGTCMRILAALLSAGRGEFELDGVARMRERPIADLVDALGPYRDGLAPEGGRPA